MVDLRPYGKLHTVLMLKEIVRRWWGVELAFADARGWVLDHAEGKIVPPANDLCRAALFSKEGFRRCNDSVKAVRDRLRAGGKGRRAVVHECHLGFDLVAAPIVFDGELAGFLFVGGAVHRDIPLVSRVELLRKVRELAPAGPLSVGIPEDTKPAELKIPELTGAELEHLMDLLEFGAAEIAAYHAELKARDRELSAVSRELGERYRFEN